MIAAPPYPPKMRFSSNTQLVIVTFLPQLAIAPPLLFASLLMKVQLSTISSFPSKNMAPPGIPSRVQPFFKISPDMVASVLVPIVMTRSPKNGWSPDFRVVFFPRRTTFFLAPIIIASGPYTSKVAFSSKCIVVGVLSSSFSMAA